MRWIFLSASFLVALVLTHLLSPYVALARLARAVETRDITALKERVDFGELRKSVSRQIAATYAARGNTGGETSPSTRFAVSAGSAMIDPLIEPYVTPEGILAILSGSPASGVLPTPNGASSEFSVPSQNGGAPILSSSISVDRLKQLFFASEMRGFTRFVVSLPPDRPKEERVGLLLRLAGSANAFTWRVVGLELPPAVRERLVRSLTQPVRKE